MAPHAIVRHRLDLVLRLIDSTTGYAIPERKIQMVMRPDKHVKPIVRDDGTYLFIGIGRTDFEIDIHVYGYESKTEKVMFEDLDENMPIKEVYLLPKAISTREDNLLTLRGTLSGIEEVEAISLSSVVCNFKEYDKRRNILKIFNQHNVKMKDVHYGILDMENEMFEHFVIKKVLSTQELELRKSLEHDYTMNQPIARIIFGQVNEDGEYILTVNAGQTAWYLVRYVVEGTVHYKKIDFNQLNGQSL